MNKKFYLMTMKDELDFRQKKIEIHNLEIEKSRKIIAEQKVRMSKLKTEIEKLERRVDNETDYQDMER